MDKYDRRPAPGEPRDGPKKMIIWETDSCETCPFFWDDGNYPNNIYKCKHPDADIVDLNDILVEWEVHSDCPLPSVKEQQNG